MTISVLDRATTVVIAVIGSAAVVSNVFHLAVTILDRTAARAILTLVAVSVVASTTVAIAAVVVPVPTVVVAVPVVAATGAVAMTRWRARTTGRAVTRAVAALVTSAGSTTAFAGWVVAPVGRWGVLGPLWTCYYL